LGQSSEIRKRLGTPLEGRKQPEYNAVLAQVRELLTTAEFELAWDEGQRISIAEAILDIL
jgi:hypothetical protein